MALFQCISQFRDAPLSLTAVRQKIEPLSWKSFRQSLAREDLVPDSHSGGTSLSHQKQ